MSWKTDFIEKEGFVFAAKHNTNILYNLLETNMGSLLELKMKLNIIYLFIVLRYSDKKSLSSSMTEND